MYRDIALPAARAGLLMLAACTPSSGPGDDPPGPPSLTAAPDCSNPAPLRGSTDAAAPGYIVVFQDGTDAQTTTAALASRYGFTPKFVYTSSLLGFAAQLSDATVASLRCEAAVRYIERDGSASTA